MSGLNYGGYLSFKRLAFLIYEIKAQSSLPLGLVE